MYPRAHDVRGGRAERARAGLRIRSIESFDRKSMDRFGSVSKADSSSSGRLIDLID